MRHDLLQHRVERRLGPFHQVRYATLEPLRAQHNAAGRARRQLPLAGADHLQPVRHALIPRAMALSAAAAMAEPPARPSTVMNGTLRVSSDSSALASTAPTNPTGTPMIAAGFGAPASSISS